jgi:AhpD family alkylhydroperoxidase
MSLVASKPLRDYPWPVRWLARRQARRYGRALSPTWLWGRLPWHMCAMLAMLGVFQRRGSPLGASLRSLVSARVAQLEGCDFCVDLNAYNLLGAEGSADKAAQVERWRESGLFSERERAALDYAEAMSISGREVEPDQLEHLRGQFSEDALVELTAWIAFQSLSAKFNAALGAEEAGLCRLPRP